MQALEVVGNFTVVELGRQEEDTALGHLFHDVQGKLELFLDITPLGHRCAREEDNGEVGCFEGLGNLDFPVLAEDQVDLVEPGWDAKSFKLFADFEGGVFVFVGVAEEHLGIGSRFG